MAVPSVHLVEGDGPRQLVYPVNQDRAVRYRIVREVIDTGENRRELAQLREEIANLPQPDNKELLELARQMHPFYSRRPELLARITELEAIVEVEQ